MSTYTMKIQDYISQNLDKNSSTPTLDRRVRIFYNSKHNCFVCQEKTIDIPCHISQSTIYPLESKYTLPDMRKFSQAECEKFLTENFDSFDINKSFSISNMMFVLSDNYISLENIYTNRHFRNSGFAKELIHDLISSAINEDSCELIKFTIYPLDTLSFDTQYNHNIARFFRERNKGMPRSRMVTLNSLIEIYNKLGFHIETATLLDSFRYPLSDLSLQKPILPREFTTFEKSKKPIILLK